MTVPARTRALAAAALVPLLLAGCGGSEDGDASTTPTSSVSAGETLDEDSGADSDTGSDASSEASEEPEQTSVFDLSQGDCFQDPSDAAIAEGIRELPVVPCDVPHDNEVYAVVELPDGDFPGAEQLQSTAETECVDAFEPYVGIAFEESEFGVFPIPPSADSWEQGDRELLCTLFLEGEQTSGSAEGSER